MDISSVASLLFKPLANVVQKKAIAVMEKSEYEILRDVANMMVSDTEKIQGKYAFLLLYLGLAPKLLTFDKHTPYLE